MGTHLTKVIELYGKHTGSGAAIDWRAVAATQHCPYLQRKCIKVRKSEPDTTIGTCTVSHGKTSQPIIICPHRLLERRQVFADCLHLLTLHEPGNQLHIVSEIGIPGGSVDYFLASARKGKVADFVGIELQTLDTTGTVWPERQRFLRNHGVRVKPKDAGSRKTFGMNWKMNAKTILVQLHHKVQTFEGINKHLVLVLQDQFMDYMRRAFTFAQLNHARLGDPVHFHVYRQATSPAGTLHLELDDRFSTDANGIAESLGLQANPKVELEEILRLVEAKIKDESTLFVPT